MNRHSEVTDHEKNIHAMICSETKSMPASNIAHFDWFQTTCIYFYLHFNLAALRSMIHKPIIKMEHLDLSQLRICPIALGSESFNRFSFQYTSFLSEIIRHQASLVLTVAKRSTLLPCVFFFCCVIGKQRIIICVILWD